MHYKQGWQSQLDGIRTMMTNVSAEIDEINERKKQLCIEYDLLFKERTRITDIIQIRTDSKLRKWILSEI